MGKNKNITIPHIETKIKIKDTNYCGKCPYRIYAKDGECVTLGVGTIYSNFIFVLPTYDTKAKIGYDTLLTLLFDAYKLITGQNMYEEVYVTRLVKCDNNTGHSIYYSAIGPCSQYLRYEVEKINAKHIIFCGSAYTDYINSSDVVGTVILNKAVYDVFSPAVMLYDGKNKDKFINDLGLILNSY